MRYLSCPVGHAECMDWLLEGGFPMSTMRPAIPTVAYLDQCCAQYRALFHHLREYQRRYRLVLRLAELGGSPSWAALTS